MAVNTGKIQGKHREFNLNLNVATLKRIEPLNDYFGQSQSQNSQETTDVTPVNTPNKSEEAKLKNDPDASSR